MSDLDKLLAIHINNFRLGAQDEETTIKVIKEDFEKYVIGEDLTAGGSDDDDIDYLEYQLQPLNDLKEEQRQSLWGDKS